MGGCWQRSFSPANRSGFAVLSAVFRLTQFPFAMLRRFLASFSAVRAWGVRPLGAWRWSSGAHEAQEFHHPRYRNRTLCTRLNSCGQAGTTRSSGRASGRDCPSLLALSLLGMIALTLMAWVWALGSRRPREPIRESRSGSLPRIRFTVGHLLFARSHVALGAVVEVLHSSSSKV